MPTKESERVAKELDAKVLVTLRDHPARSAISILNTIGAPVGAEYKRAQAKLALSLQRLRKAGLITSRHGSWSLVREHQDDDDDDPR